MKDEDLLLAIKILMDYHSNEVVINQTKPGGAFDKNKPTLHIKNCVASAINKLVEMGFSLSMDNGLLSVNKY